MAEKKVGVETIDGTTPEAGSTTTPPPPEPVKPQPKPFTIKNTEDAMSTETTNEVNGNLTEKLVTREKDGAQVGQQVPTTVEENPLTAKAEKAGNAYRSGRGECPACHVSDGVREGAPVCDSCGARIA